MTVREGSQAAVAGAVEATGGEVAVTYDKAMDGLAVTMTPVDAVLLKMRSDVTAVELDLPVSIDVPSGPNDGASGGAVLTDSGCLANSMSRNDDYGTGPVSIASVTTANWFGSAYSQILINNNGGFSFNDGNGAFTSYSGVNLNTTTRPLVLPLFTDLDTTNSLTTVVQYGPLTNTFGDRPGYCINWVNVGRFSASAPVYSAQALIINRDDRRPGDIDIVFNYDTIASSTSANPLEIGFANPSDRTKSVRFASSGANPNPYVDGGTSALISGRVTPPSGSPYTAKNGRYVYQVVNSATASPTPTPTSTSSCSTPVSAGTQGCATWGLDRIDQLTSALDQLFTPAGTGTGVTAYIVDTGVYTAHTEFTGRTSTGRNTTVTPADSDTTDCQGHGTHVAGTVAGTIYGVAKSATVVPVKVLDCSGSGTTSGVIAGLDWIIGNHAAGVPAVANMSLGGGKSTALNTAVANLVADGVTVVVAAGNETQDACNVSPASEPTAITVGATTSSDALAYYSNYGSCVDILAPGSSITSAGISSTTATAVMSGTSMASPHTAGAAAVYVGLNTSATPAQVVAALTSAATANVISGVSGSPNKLLYVRSFAASSTPPAVPPAGGGSSGGSSSGGGSSGGGSSGGGSSEGGGGGSDHEITSVQPASGPIGGGNTIAVVGFGFTGASAALIGGKAASFRVVNDARVDVVVPPGDALGSADVSIVLSPTIGRAFAPGGYVYVSGAAVVSTPSTSAQPTSTGSASAAATVTAPLVIANPQAVTAAQLATYSPAQLATVPGATLALLSPKALAGITPSQAAALTPAQLSFIRPTQAAALTPALVDALSPEQLAGFRPAAVARLRPSAIATMSAEQLAGLRTTAFARLTAAQAAVVTPEQVGDLSAAQVAKIKPTSLARLDPDALAAMTTAQLLALTPSQVRALTGTQRAALTPAQLRLLG
ncbi:MAG: S8 family serine peptidase [Candidatus Nanopelagicales bacterium]